MGDFNVEPSEKTYQIFTQKMKNLELSFEDCRPTSNTDGTFCGFVINQHQCKIIDYIFVSSHWKTTNFEVIHTNDGKHYPSDHKPVAARMVLK